MGELNGLRPYVAEMYFTQSHMNLRFYLKA